MVSAICLKAQDTTIVFRVNGNAGCKVAIEHALSGVQGISSANWDATNKKMTVVYNTQMVREDLIHTYIASEGYDTNLIRSKQAKYDALPAECKYLRDIERD